MFFPVPSIEPIAASPSLLTSARPLPGANSRDEAGLPPWRTGVSWVPVGCQPSHVWPRCPVVTDPRTEKEAPNGTRSEVHTDVFYIYTPLSCDWVVDGVKLDDDAKLLTDVHTVSHVARALWMGDGLPDETDQPTMRNSAVDVSFSGEMQVDDVVARLLSDYRDCTDGAGGAVLHMPDVLVPAALEARLIWPEGNVYRGPFGAVVSPGPGYPRGDTDEGADGAGPLVSPGVYAGNDLDQVWIYVTGPVEYALGDVRVLGEEEMERRSGVGRRNTYEVTAERMALVRFDPCCVFASLATNPAGMTS